VCVCVHRFTVAWRVRNHYLLRLKMAIQASVDMDPVTRSYSKG